MAHLRSAVQDDGVVGWGRAARVQEKCRGEWVKGQIATSATRRISAGQQQEKPARGKSRQDEQGNRKRRYSRPRLVTPGEGAGIARGPSPFCHISVSQSTAKGAGRQGQLTVPRAAGGGEGSEEPPALALGGSGGL